MSGDLGGIYFLYSLVHYDSVVEPVSVQCMGKTFLSKNHSYLLGILDAIYLLIVCIKNIFLKL